MSQHHPTTPVSEPEPGADQARTRALQWMVLGGVVAVLGPLGGFLAGSMIGPSARFGDYDAMFVAMFAGLFLGGIGAVVAILGALRFVRHHGRLY
jgi:hypothetical protein